MEEKLSILKCRKILGEAGRNLSDKEIEVLRDTFIALSDFVIDEEIEKLRLKEIKTKYEKQK